jgi:hypothetical protein
MVGHGRPIRLLLLVTSVMWAAFAVLRTDVALADEVTARFRIAWGAGPQSPQAWTGAITVSGAKLTDMRPIGIESDEAAALRLGDGRIDVAPIVPRAFDGCDITVRGDAAAQVTVRLRSSSAELRELTVPLSDLMERPYSAPLDELGGYLLIDRAPGDRLRVRLDRDHLVLSPSEPFKLTVEPSFTSTSGELTLAIQLQAATGGRVLWEQMTPIQSTNSGEFAFEVPTPAIEGAYRLSLVLRGREGLATKLTPWQTHPPLASRVVEFVVIDPALRLPRITPALELVQSIDVANPKWYQRVPEWTQLDRLPVLAAPRPIGNVKAEPRQIGESRFVALPPPTAGAELSWQAYPLAIRDVGQPHVVEIDLPAAANQQLGASILEPDAAGRVMSFGREAGAYVDARQSATPSTETGLVKHRIAFWPRTATPVLLLANQSRSSPATYGMVRVWRRQLEPVITEAATAAAALDGDASKLEAASADRLIAAYISLPQFADCLGGAETYDEAGRLSVKGWTAFLEGVNRLAQQLQSAGYNAVVVSVAAQGSSLAPLGSLGASPRFDTGGLASNGADPLRKDVLEALLRVFDREGIKAIPAIELATPLPALEVLRRSGEAQRQGIECVLPDGRTWSAQSPGQSSGPHYNILNSEVQGALAGVVQQVIDRYGRHSSFGGVALQLSGRGFGVLPSSTWPLDDQTAEKFTSVTGRALPRQGDDRFKKREQLVMASMKNDWLAWRQSEVTKFYAALGGQIQSSGASRQLVLCTENLFAGAEASLVLRRSLGGRATIEEAALQIGVDLNALATTPGVTLLRPRRLGSDAMLEPRALDLIVNSASDYESSTSSQPGGELLFHETRRLNLTSFDAQTPFGAGTTRVAMNMASYPSGHDVLRPWAMALASRDASLVVEGGELLPLVVDDELAGVRRLLQELPGAAEAEVRTELRQPVALRIYRTPDSTILLLVNDSSWASAVDVQIDSVEAVAWSDLGGGAGATRVASGATPKGRDPWKLWLPPYGVVARRYATRGLKVGAWTVTPDAAANAELASRIQDIESRMHSLEIERPYPQLHNPDFELGGGSELSSGWQPRIGKSGKVEVAAAADAGKALHLVSEDGLGVAAQSQRFPIPATGQLTVRARVRGGATASKARMYVWVECDPGLGLEPTHMPADEGMPVSSEWSELEVVFEDLPLASSAQMKVQFHLVGVGEAWVDGVELFDLRFSSERQNKLAKQMMAARMALEEGQLVDCQRLIDGYWPRYLVANLPAAPALPVGTATPDVRIATKPDDAPAAQETKAPGFGERVRGIFR